MNNTDEHDVEKVDTILAGLSVQYLALSDDSVTVLIDDDPATTVTKTAVQSVEFREDVRVLTLEDVIGDTDNDITLISCCRTSANCRSVGCRVFFWRV